MKYLKTFGLALVAALALMAFVGAGSASATVICKTNTTPCSEKYPAGTEYKASLAVGTSMKLTTTEGTTLNTCAAATLTGKTENLGSATETVRGPVAATGLTFSNCSAGTVTTTEGGVTETHSITGTANGTYTAKGFKITVNTPFGPCTYTGGSATHIGTVTGGAPATVDVNAVVTRLSPDPDAGICPASARWQATYTVTSPNPLYVKES
jgi:hypothetical protein